MSKINIGIAGSSGMVGGAIKRYFKSKKNYKLHLYDKYDAVGSAEELNKADYIYIAVPTPYKDKIGCDTSIVEEIVDGLDDNKIIIIKSTIIPGTTDKLQYKYPNQKILFSPEFLTELTADNDMSFPDRQIVGYTKESYNVAKDVLQQLPLAPFERMMPAKDAEMVKYFNNTWFSTKVIFANQIYDLCEEIGVDYEAVMDSAAADKRIGRTHLKIFHHDYRGYGGKCLPKDTKALIHFADKNGINMRQLKVTDYINDKLTKQ